MRKREWRMIDSIEPKMASGPYEGRAMQEPREAGNAGGPESRHEEVRNEEGEAAPSVLWTLWDEAEERGDRDVAALMWEAMYGRGPER